MTRLTRARLAPTTPVFEERGVRVFHGDCLDVLRSLPDMSVDAVVTDPPYGLGTPPDPRVVLEHWLAGDDYQHTGGGFMGRSWDSFVPGPAVWSECLRVLKPGGHLLAFFGTRTADIGGLAIRIAGFDIRDTIAWMYGSGFPKSLDVSKAIDRRPGVSAHREFARHLADRRVAAGLSRADVSEHVVGTRSGACWNWEHHQFPEARWWTRLRDLLGLDETWGSVIAEAERTTIALRSGTSIAVAPGQNSERTAVSLEVTEPETEAAREWDGWGTALKPAFEPVIVARRPLVGTVAANVLEHGTGAINIDGCRIGNEVRFNPPTRKDETSSLGSFANCTGVGSEVSGRWPANVTLDEAAAEVLDAQTGELVSGSRREDVRTGLGYHGADSDGGQAIEGSAGGASRFFYTSKAGSGERLGSKHPTVKPVDLMRWLVRLVTPPGGVVLDPFAGTGTTGQAAIEEGFPAILVEREAEYLPDIRRRLVGWGATEGTLLDGVAS